MFVFWRLLVDGVNVADGLLFRDESVFANVALKRACVRVCEFVAVEVVEGCESGLAKIANEVSLGGVCDGVASESDAFEKVCWTKVALEEAEG